MWFFLINKNTDLINMFQLRINIEGHKLKSVEFFCPIFLSTAVAVKSKQVGIMLFDSEGTAYKPYYLLPKEWELGKVCNFDILS